MKISELIDCISKKDIVLPEFQREYVWTKEQAKQLFVSLYKDYPIGSLLFWMTDNPPELKNINEKLDKLGTVQVILDGQQRLTTLYLLVTGDIPPYYTEKDIYTEKDPRELYFNLDTGDFQYYKKLEMSNNPLWVKVKDCLSNKMISVSSIVKQIITNDDGGLENINVIELVDKYTNNYLKLKNIMSNDLSVQKVPSTANLEEAIDIFDRVNSQGTKLTEAELALTHVTGKWFDARRIIKNKIEQLDNKYFYFDLTFITRALNAISTTRGEFEHLHKVNKEILLNSWNKLDKILDYITSLLPSKLCIHSTEDLNSPNTLIPIIFYLSSNDCKFKTEEMTNNASKWLYLANLWARYSSQTSSKLELDLSIVRMNDNIFENLTKQIIDQRGRIRVESVDLEGRGVQHPLYEMTYILTKIHGAIDWFNGLPLGKANGKYYQIHSHHIFPQSLLYENGFSKESRTDVQLVNEIANRAFLTSETNISISNKSPDSYLPEIEYRYPGALSKQFIPMNVELWKVKNYREFLFARRALISMKINEYIESFNQKHEEIKGKPITEIISYGESLSLEFKSTLQWDVIQNKQNKDLRYSILKTIVAFLNTGGGKLLIGVEDDGKIRGLEDDLKLVNNSKDIFMQTIANVINETIGPEYTIFIRANIQSENNKLICVIDVERSASPAYLKNSKGNKEFYVRNGNTSRLLDSEETVSYISNNWN